MADSVACSGRQSLETFDGYTRGSYAHQFANVACRGSAYFQQAFVEWLWQQMNEWKFREMILCEERNLVYILVRYALLHREQVRDHTVHTPSLAPQKEENPDR